jgi:molybdopterin converting factor subunit 1
MKINLRLFSTCRDIVGSREVAIDVPRDATVGDLLEVVLRRYPRLRPLEKPIILAVNKDFADSKVRLREKDEVALMPPIGGG